MIQKITLRDQVRTYLQQEMLGRNITIGQRLSLAEISRKIDVSVTPIREALTQLEQAGIVETIANKGFFVPKLSAKEAAQIYPVIYSLETLALKNINHSPEDIDVLKAIQTRFKDAPNGETAVKLDLQFHAALIENYKNEVAKQILNDLKIRVFFYEFEYMKDSESHQKSITSHQNMIKALEAGNKEQVCNLLENNWLTSAHFIEKMYRKLSET